MANPLDYAENLTRERSWLPTLQFDTLMVACLAVVMVIGLMVMSGILAGNQALLVRHIVILALGVLVMLGVAQLSEDTLYGFAPLIYIGTVVLLVVVLFFGYSAKGASRWLDLPGLPRFQPSEFLKIAIPLMLAWYLSRTAMPLRLVDVVVCLAIIALPVLLVYQQPDLGTTILVAAAGLTVLFVAGLKWRYVIASGLLAIIGAVVAWRVILSEYQIARIATFLNPENNPLGTGWNIIQSKIALGSGGTLGKGLGEGTQSQLSFLPEGHTDFILAVIGEELGFIGTVTLVTFFFFIFARGMLMSRRAPTRFSQLAIFGIVMMFFGYMLTNTMMVCGLLPVVGVPLPFVSYGGTALLTYLAGFGIVIALHGR